MQQVFKSLWLQLTTYSPPEELTLEKNRLSAMSVGRALSRAHTSFSIREFTPGEAVRVQ